MAALTLEVVHSVKEIDAATWDGLAGEDNPFVEHAFLVALEDSGSVGQGTGWAPLPLVVRSGTRIVGVAPLYLKSHSYGEYIFDWGWADAAQRAGLPYYPKLVVAAPFTPATGPRMLIDPAVDPPPVRQALAAGARAVAEHVNASSVHWLFIQEDEAAALASHGEIRRLTYQYHWINREYESFDAFLGTFRSKERKQAKRERRRALASGLRLSTLHGAELEPRQWAALYPLYRSTTGKKGAHAYLTREFFELLPERLAHRVVVTMAERGDEVVAAALAFRKGPHLYGRYWGCREDHDALHFELCYHRFVEYSIEHGLARFEAGAQGRHKIKRGFLPCATHSAHWLAHPGLDGAVRSWVEMEREENRFQMSALADHGPFRQDP